MLTYEKIIKNIYQTENRTIIEIVSALISPHSEKIAKSFYREMLSNPESAMFLNHDMVKKRLTMTMTEWISSIFLYRDNEENIKQYLDYQSQIGRIHSRIGLPVKLVNYGMYLIKNDISNLLLNSELNRNDLAKALMISNQIIDCMLQIINQSYEFNLVVNEKDDQTFKIQFSTHHLAFDCERLRNSLSDWMRDLLLNIQQDSFDASSVLTIRHSNFGLWVTHKAKLFLSNRPEFTNLVQLLDEMDEVLQDLIIVINQNQSRQELLKQLNTLVSQASWVLGEISKDIIDQDNGRDSLTRLFNRRYLDTVLRHETTYSLKNSVTFGLVMIDIDFFKHINDTYGHDSGDKVLAQMADILTHEVRASDFVFRLGGEEFLIVLGDVNQRIIHNVAEKIRFTVSNSTFHLGNNKTLKITVSIGTAIYDGHPDFQRTIKLADDALYKAKQQGRNRIIAAEQLPLTYAQLNNVGIVNSK